ncbi:MAG: Mov34/MPN/PAD-1 family protein [Flavisolibacter sp.]
MLHIDSKAMEKMIKDAERTFPDECCGFFFGKEEENIRFISAITVVDNSKDGDKRRRFKISAKDYLKAENFADENELTLLGVYHSHPNSPAIPSEHDRVSAQPYFSYIIISVFDGLYSHARSWQLNYQYEFEEEKIKNQSFITQIN